MLCPVSEREPPLKPSNLCSLSWIWNQSCSRCQSIRYVALLCAAPRDILCCCTRTLINFSYLSKELKKYNLRGHFYFTACFFVLFCFVFFLMHRCDSFCPETHVQYSWSIGLGSWFLFLCVCMCVCVCVFVHLTPHCLCIWGWVIRWDMRLIMYSEVNSLPLKRHATHTHTHTHTLPLWFVIV